MISEFKIPLHRFDLNLLPADARQIGSESFKMAVTMHFAAEYAASGQNAIVTVDDKAIGVMTFPRDADALDMIMPMLKEGKLAEAVPYLEAINKSEPGSAAVLYNLGLCYSELGQFDEAIIRLKRAVQLEPKHAHAWIGIGNAYHRMRKPEQALEAFTEALKINPNDGYTQRNLGGMLLAMKRPAEGVPHLRKALALMPDDPQSIYGLAMGLSDLDTAEADLEADGLFKRIITEHPTAPVVEQAEKARTRLAHKGLQAGAVGGLRLDVVAYLTDALKTFAKVGPAKMRAIGVEVAMLGRSGLDINNPAKQYKLKNLPGDFSGLHLLAILYAAFQQIDPSADLGADFAAEYAVALKAAKGR
jgi:tetratricopeptide (TPR) repeat protein